MKNIRKAISILSKSIIIVIIAAIANYMFCFTNYNHDITYEESRDYKVAYNIYEDYKNNEYCKSDIVDKMGAPYFWNEKVKRWERKNNYMDDSHWIYPNLIVESYFDYAESEYYNLEIFFDNENRINIVKFDLGI